MNSKGTSELGETVLQFGGGRFLRAFVDRFIQHANDAGQRVGRVVVVQSTDSQRADALNSQPDGYHIVLRGLQDGNVVDRVEKIQSVSRALNANGQWPAVLEFAKNPELRWIVSNATEAGYQLDASDQPESSPPKSLPAKLTVVLWARFQAGGRPVTMLPCELIEQNAEKLHQLVVDQTRLWNLSPEFEHWLTGEVTWLSSLVDCIVTGPPHDHALVDQDALLACAEPYAFWALEKPAGRSVDLFHDPAIHLVDQLAPYYLRKVRMLNGVHSALVAKFLSRGFVTVQEVMKDKAAQRWVRDLLFEEIVPTLAYRLEGVAHFADDVLERLQNPFQAHKLTDIALNHRDKVRVRLEPTAAEYLKLFGVPAQRLTEAINATVQLP